MFSSISRYIGNNPCFHITASGNLHRFLHQQNSNANFPTAVLQSNGRANLHNGCSMIQRPLLDPNGCPSIQRSFGIWYLLMCTTVVPTHGRHQVVYISREVLQSTPNQHSHNNHVQRKARPRGGEFVGLFDGQSRTYIDQIKKGETDTSVRHMSAGLQGVQYMLAGLQGVRYT